MKYLLDTNVCADYLNGRYPSVTGRMQRSAPEDLVISSVVAAELRYGADKSARPERNHARLDVLLAELTCLDFDLDAASEYGRLRTELERQGRPIGPYDLMIAAQALARELVLVTDNLRELGRVEGLVVENWREDR